MESAAVPAEAGGVAPGDKGLKTGALGYLSNLVISVASTAPAYSLAATLGFVVAVAGMGVHAPAVMIVSFIPMLLIAAAYNYMNKADPDCGTSFTWVTRAMGPRLGWLTGWAIVAADVIVMATLAYIAGVYTFLLFGLDAAADQPARRQHRRRDLDRRDDLDLLRRDRALGTHAVRPARRWRSSRWPCSRSWPWSRSTREVPRRGRSTSRSTGSRPFSPARWQHRAGRRGAARRLHLLGLGQRRLRQRGVRGLRRGARARQR